MEGEKYKPTKEEEGLIIEISCDLASTIHRFIHDREEAHKFGITIVGVAIEMILSNAPHWDKSSEEFREFLGSVHNDLKKMLKEGGLPS